MRFYSHIFFVQFFISYICVQQQTKTDKMKSLIKLFVITLLFCSCSNDDDESNNVVTITSFTVESSYYKGMWSVAEDKDFQSKPFTVIEVIGKSGNNEFSIPGYGYSYKIRPNSGMGDNWYTATVNYPKRSGKTTIIIKGYYD